MTLQEIIETSHDKLDINQKLVKTYYINELLRLDSYFDDILRAQMLKSIKRGHVPAKRVGLADFTPEEILDLNQKIEQ